MVWLLTPYALGTYKVCSLNPYLPIGIISFRTDFFSFLFRSILSLTLHGRITNSLSHHPPHPPPPNNHGPQQHPPPTPHSPQCTSHPTPSNLAHPPLLFQTDTSANPYPYPHHSSTTPQRCYSSLENKSIKGRTHHNISIFQGRTMIVGSGIWNGRG